MVILIAELRANSDKPLSKQFYLSFYIIMVFLGVSVAGCAQPGIEQPVVQETLTLPATNNATTTALPLPTSTPPDPSATFTPPVVKETSSLQLVSPISIENAPKLELANTISIPGATDFRWCKHGQSLCIALPGEVKVYDLAVSETDQHVPAINPKQLTVAPGGDVLAWVDNDNQIRIWDVQKNLYHEIDSLAESVIDLSFKPDGTSLVASDGNLSIQSWSLDGVMGDIEINYPTWLVDLDFSPDGTQLAGVSQDEFATIIFDAESGTELQRLAWLDHASPVLYGAFFSPDWNTLAWVTRGTIQLMDVQNEEFGPMLGHEDFIVATDWSPNSDLIAAAAAGTVGEEYKPLVTLWDPISGMPVASLAHDAPLLQISFSPDGSQLVSLDSDGNLHFWKVAED